MKVLHCKTFGAPREVLSVEDAPMPEISRPDEVIVRVHYASVSHATGLMIEGKYQRKPPFPFSPGTEAVGIVEQKGSAVTHLSIGQRVACICDWGAYAEYLKLPQTWGVGSLPAPVRRKSVRWRKRREPVKP